MVRKLFVSQNRAAPSFGKLEECIKRTGKIREKHLGPLELERLLPSFTDSARTSIDMYFGLQHQLKVQQFPEVSNLVLKHGASGHFKRMRLKELCPYYTRSASESEPPYAHDC